MRPFLLLVALTGYCFAANSDKDVVVDVTFIIDVSSSAKDKFNDMSNFITTLMDSYTVNQKNARVALLPVGGVNSPSIPTAFFNTISSNSMLEKYIKDIREHYNDFENSGQSLGGALTEVASADFISAGYRSNQPNHLLIYVTATSTFTDSPSIDSIRSSKNYGMITIGYGSGATDGAALQALSGTKDCYFHAENTAELAKAAPKVRSLISAGKYCLF